MTRRNSWILENKLINFDEACELEFEVKSQVCFEIKYFLIKCDLNLIIDEFEVDLKKSLI